MAAMLASATPSGGQPAKPPAAGKQWFVRPAGPQPYGKADGSSYDSAWGGFPKIAWKSIQPGDTLYIGDVHAGERLIVQASGVEGRRVTIRGDYPGHPGAILGASAVLDGGWSLHSAGQNVWKRSFEKPEPYSGLHAFARPKDSDPLKGMVRLHNVGEPAQGGSGVKADFAKWAPGTYYLDEGAQGGTLYFKPFAGAANDWVYYAGYEPACVRIERCKHFDVRNLTIMMGAGGKDQGVVRLHSCDHVTLDGLAVRWGALGIVFGPSWGGRHKPDAVSEDIVVSNCVVRDCRSGIYPNGGVKNCRISDNHVFDIGQDGYYMIWRKNRWHGDIHGIALQGGGDGLVIERNHVHHIGGEGIFPYSDNNPEGVNVQEMRNFRIQYNLVHDIKYIGCPAKPTRASSGMQSALYYNQNNDFPSEGMSGNVMAYNVLYNAEHGVRMKCNANKQTGQAPWAVYNNMIYNVDVGVCWYSSGPKNPHNKPGVVFKNNIIMNARRAFVQIAPPTIKEYDQVLFDNNIYFPDIPGGFVWPEGKGDFAGWRGWTAGAKRDARSMTADPRVVDAQKAVFGLQAGSPAIDAGADVGLAKDMDSNSVPQGKSPDIGPYEYRPGAE